MTIVESLQELWDRILEFTAMFVMPDWNTVIAFLPVLIFLGVVGPLITFLALGIFVYQVRKPRVKTTFEEGPRTAGLDADGRPVFPPGLPYCRRDALVYTSGTQRCDVCRDQLAVVCPMCSTGRSAQTDTCGNCGLVLKVEQRSVATTRRGRPKPGGAAAA